MLKNKIPLITLIASVILVLLTLWRIYAVVFADPIMGYANNYDFIRQSSCTGVWQSYPNGKSKFEFYPAHPVNSLVYDGEKIKELCIKSSDNLFPHILKKFHKIGDKFNFEKLSILKAIFLGLLFFPALFIIKKHSHKFLFSLLFFLIFSDLYNLLYINTLYLEFSAITGIFIAVGLMIFYEKSKKLNWIYYILLLISLLWLIFSKQQYMPLGILFGLLFAVILWKNQEKNMALVFTLILISTPFIHNRFYSEKYQMVSIIDYANKTNTFLWTVLPQTADPKATLTSLKLPAHCASAVGLSWYSPEMQPKHLCPEIKTVSRAQLVPIFITEPKTFWIPMYKALQELSPFYPDHLGQVENPQYTQSSAYAFLKATSLIHWLDVLTNKSTIVVLAGLAALSSLLSFLIYLLTPLKNQDSSTHLLLIGLGGMIMIYAIGSSVFGDGYFELRKHAVAFPIGFAFYLVGVLVWISHRIRSFSRSRSTLTHSVS